MTLELTINLPPTHIISQVPQTRILHRSAIKTRHRRRKHNIREERWPKMHIISCESRHDSSDKLTIAISDEEGSRKYRQQSYLDRLSKREHDLWKTKLCHGISLLDNKIQIQVHFMTKQYLYSSLIPYAIIISGSSVMTALAAAFMSSRARRSFGFSKAYLSENLFQSIS